MYQKNPGSSTNLLTRKLSFIILFAITIITSASAQTMQTSQVAVYTRLHANVGGFLESLPNDYAANPAKKYPLLIAMHGVGERGNGAPGILEKVANVAIPKRIKTGGFPASFTVGGKSFSFIVISPQMENASDWRASIQAVIDYSKAHYRVDESRIYLTGLSLGGVCEWVFLGNSVANSQQLAAALLCTPGTDFTATQLNNVAQAQLPIWVTNNSGDPYNHPTGATALVNALNSTVPAHPKTLITIFDKSGHDAWTQTYDPAFKQDGLNIYEWMLTKTRGGSQGSPGTPVLTANAGPDQILVLPTNAVTLDASASKVTSGTITSYSWTKVSGPPAGAVSLLSNGLQAKLSGLAAGTYVYQLTVKDSNGSTVTDNITITVNSTSVSTDPPVANAGKGQTITLPTNSVSLSGSLSTASSGNTIVSYKWVKLASSPAGGDLNNANSVNTTVSNLIAGTYTFNLTVTDSRGVTKTGGTTVVVNPGKVISDVPPTVVVASSMINMTLPSKDTTLDGSASVASQGNSIASYQWTKAATSPAGGDIASPASAKTTVSNLTVGTYTYNLTVTDSRGMAKTANTTVIVNTSSEPPVVIAGSDQVITMPANSANVDGSSSTASAGNTIASYQWTKAATSPAGGDIISPASAKTTVSNLTAGTYTYNLTVTDSRGVAKTASTTIVINTSSEPPVVIAGADQAITLPVNSVNVDGSSSTVSAGNTIVSYQWTKVATSPAGGDIISPAGASTAISNLIAGTYIFNLTVTDSRGNATSDSVIVVVSPAPASTTPPTALVASSMINLTLPLNEATLDGSSSVASAGNTIVSYKWTKYTGPSYSGIKTPTDAKITITKLVAGSYGFTLTVTDNNGKTSKKNVAVIVKAAASTRTAAVETSTTESLALGNGTTPDAKVFEASITPNTVQSTMNIRVNGSAAGKTSILVYSVAGQLQLQQEFAKDANGVSRQVNISKLPAGMYIVQIIIDNKYKQVLRIVKQ